MKVLPAASAGIPAVAALRLGFALEVSMAAIRLAFRTAAARMPARLLARKSRAAADAEIIGAGPNAASNIRLKVEKLANASDPKVSFTASRSEVVPVGLNGTSGPESLQPVRATHTAAAIRTDRFAN